MDDSGHHPFGNGTRNVLLAHINGFYFVPAPKVIHRLRNNKLVDVIKGDTLSDQLVNQLRAICFVTGDGRTCVLLRYIIQFEFWGRGFALELIKLKNRGLYCWPSQGVIHLTSNFVGSYDLFGSQLCQMI